jgi:hypothetical protein
MKQSTLIALLFSLNIYLGKAQDGEELPYRVIPEAPANYSEGAVVARMVDGLGFRYYWATEGLRAEDLSFRPSSEARTTEETLDHILGLSQVILNSALHRSNSGNPTDGLSYLDKRKQTLINLKKAADIFRTCDDLSVFTVVFERDNRNTSFPFWNQINGPISDAIWHCGQVVSFRRSSGNPFNPKVSVFLGNLRE